MRQRLRALAHERRRFGYRRLHVLLRREGFQVNHKRLFRIYRDERLMVRRRGGRKRALGTRAPMLIPQWPNDRWSLDFVADQFLDGRRMRILVVVDDCTRECLALVADTSISGRPVAREFDRIIAVRGRPGTIVTDNGTEFTSNAILAWSEDRGVCWHYIAPGKPTQNAFVESFHTVAIDGRTQIDLGDQRPDQLHRFRPGLLDVQQPFHIAGILAASKEPRLGSTRRGSVSDVSQIDLVAGTGFEPVTFRL